MLLSLIEDTSPEWQDKFLSYKDLKEQLKLIYANKLQRGECFVNLLGNEIDNFNTFFIEKEKDYIIQLKVLRDSITEIRESEELMRVGTDLVDLHGQMILLENYSALNYIQFSFASRAGILRVVTCHNFATSNTTSRCAIQKCGLRSSLADSSSQTKSQAAQLWLLLIISFILFVFLNSNQLQPIIMQLIHGSDLKSEQGSFLLEGVFVKFSFDIQFKLSEIFNLYVNAFKECEALLSSLLSQNEPSKAPEGEGSTGGGSSEGVTGGSSSRVEELAKMKNPSKAVPGGEGSSERLTSVAKDLSEIQNTCIKTPGGERSSGVEDAEEFVEMDNMGSMYLKVTKSALNVLQEISPVDVITSSGLKYCSDLERILYC
ncbi:hypothetical protein RDI58_014928 [Solanum bulbocastanum]|uniref:SPX domain-containing protein n=1 Tax=Solanum bulbocastanum TaxID=147425 RepID=A0AAN8YEG7_SOLBU